MFIHHEQLIQLLQTDSNSFWYKLFPKLKSQHPEMPAEEANAKLMPRVMFLTLMQRPDKPDAVCFMPAFLLKSHGNDRIFRVDLAFETAVEGVFDVQRHLRVATMQNVNPTDMHMAFVEATQRGAIAKLLAPNEEEAKLVMQQQLEILQAKDISELLKGANINIKHLAADGQPQGVIKMPGNLDILPSEGQPPIV